MGALRCRDEGQDRGLREDVRWQVGRQDPKGSQGLRDRDARDEEGPRLPQEERGQDRPLSLICWCTVQECDILLSVFPLSRVFGLWIGRSPPPPLPNTLGFCPFRHLPRLSAGVATHTLRSRCVSLISLAAL